MQTYSSFNAFTIKQCIRRKLKKVLDRQWTSQKIIFFVIADLLLTPVHFLCSVLTETSYLRYKKKRSNLTLKQQFVQLYWYIEYSPIVEILHILNYGNYRLLRFYFKLLTLFTPLMIYNYSLMTRFAFYLCLRKACRPWQLSPC